MPWRLSACHVAKLLLFFNDKKVSFVFKMFCFRRNKNERKMDLSYDPKMVKKLLFIDSTALA
jgi:hypothetical protein